LPSELKGIDSKSFIERSGARLNCVMDGFNCVMDGFNCVMDGFNCVMDGFNCVMDGFNCVMDGFNCMMDGFNWFAACVSRSDQYGRLAQFPPLSGFCPLTPPLCAYQITL
jgi:hypothetical protein